MTGPGIPGGRGEAQQTQALIHERTGHRGRFHVPCPLDGVSGSSIILLGSFKSGKEPAGRCSLSLPSVQSSNGLTVCTSAIDLEFISDDNPWLSG